MFVVVAGGMGVTGIKGRKNIKGLTMPDKYVWGVSSPGSAGKLCMGTEQEVNTKPADYGLADCSFVPVTHRTNRKGRSACFSSPKLSHHLLGKQSDKSAVEKDAQEKKKSITTPSRIDPIC